MMNGVALRVRTAAYATMAALTLLVLLVMPARAYLGMEVDCPEFAPVGSSPAIEVQLRNFDGASANVRLMAGYIASGAGEAFDLGIGGPAIAGAPVVVPDLTSTSATLTSAPAVPAPPPALTGAAMEYYVISEWNDGETVLTDNCLIAVAVPEPDASLQLLFGFLGVLMLTSLRGPTPVSARAGHRRLTSQART